MNARTAYLTDLEILRMRRRGRDPLQGLSAFEVRQIERQALAKLRRMLMTPAMCRLRELLAEAERQRRPAAPLARLFAATEPGSPVSELVPTDFDDFPSLRAVTTQAQGRVEPVRRTGLEK